MPREYLLNSVIDMSIKTVGNQIKLDMLFFFVLNVYIQIP